MMYGLRKRELPPLFPDYWRVPEVYILPLNDDIVIYTMGISPRNYECGLLIFLCFPDSLPLYGSYFRPVRQSLLPHIRACFTNSIQLYDSGIYRDINTLVMNYLIIEGYPSAALKFAQEANINPQIDLQSIHERNKICTAINEGNVQTAIEMINDICPEVRSQTLKNFLNFFFRGSFYYVIGQKKDIAMKKTLLMHHSQASSGVSDEKQTP